MLRAATRIRTLSPSLLALLVAGIVAPGAEGQVRDNRDATIGLFLTEARGDCRRIEPIACNDEGIQVTGNLYTPYYAVLCVFNGDPEEGVAGMSFGIDYDGGISSGVDVFNWYLCGDLEFDNGNWPEPGGGNRITWDPEISCQTNEPGGSGTGVTAVAGYFYISVYSDDRLSVTKNFNLFSGPELVVTACNAAESDLEGSQAGWLGFSDTGEEQGDLPCLEREVTETTWGDVKKKYGDGGR